MIGDIRSHLEASPFVPFRILTADGCEYPVPTSEHIYLPPGAERAVVSDDEGNVVVLPASLISSLRPEAAIHEPTSAAALKDIRFRQVCLIVGALATLTGVFSLPKHLLPWWSNMLLLVSGNLLLRAFGPRTHGGVLRGRDAWVFRVGGVGVLLLAVFYVGVERFLDYWMWFLIAWTPFWLWKECQLIGPLPTLGSWLKRTPLENEPLPAGPDRYNY